MSNVLVKLARTRRLGLTGVGREIRESCGISLIELADHIDVDPGTLSRWERGLNRPRTAASLRWERALAELASSVESG